ECRAPDLRAGLLTEVFKELREAGNEIALGDEHIDRNFDFEVATDLIETLANGGHMVLALTLIQRHQIARADRDHDAVDRLTTAELTQQLEEGAPTGRIRPGVRVLRGIAAGGIQEN